MIIFIPVVLKTIFKEGKKYSWPRPERCPRCGRYKVWGHGYVLSIFDGFSDTLWLKRYRCPQCHCIIKLRPAGYFKRFQASIKTIRTSIVNKSQKGRWLSGISRSRQCHWYRAFLRKIYALNGNNTNYEVSAVFDRFVSQGLTPASRSI